MNTFQLFAEPWWVNLLVAIPFVAYLLWRKDRLSIGGSILIITAIFGITFGFNEAVVVVYLRGVIGALPGLINNNDFLSNLSPIFAQIEFWREAATMVMLLCIAMLSVKTIRERTAVFLWTFAFWDIFYYAGLWVIVRWPVSLLSPDVLFLIPVPWLAQVWFPLLVSGLSIVAVLLARKK